MSHRNEPARSRRRQQLRQQLSLRSIPLVEPPSEKYNLDNHFGWKVMQKCRVGDGSLPPFLLHCLYCDKPDVPHSDDGDHDKVMYVLYIRGKDDDLGHVDIKETQTSSMSTAPRPAAEPAQRAGEEPPPAPKVNMARFKDHRRKLLSDFYYIPIRERIIEKYDIRQLPESHPGDGKKRSSKGRTAPKSWQLRAGAECPDEDNMEAEDVTDTDLSPESETEEEEEPPATLIDNFKRYSRIPTVSDCSNCFGKSPTNAQLMESPLEKNKFLYLPEERYQKRSTSPRPTSATRKCIDTDDQQ